MNVYLTLILTFNKSALLILNYEQNVNENNDFALSAASNQFVLKIIFLTLYI